MVSPYGIPSIPSTWSVTEWAPPYMFATWAEGMTGTYNCARHEARGRNTVASLTSAPGIPRSTSQPCGRNQEGNSQSHLPSRPGSRVRGRFSGHLCGKEAGAVSILFHIHHELCLTDMRSHRRNTLPSSLQPFKSRGPGKMLEGNKHPWLQGTEKGFRKRGQHRGKSKKQKQLLVCFVTLSK